MLDSQSAKAEGHGGTFNHASAKRIRESRHGQAGDGLSLAQGLVVTTPGAPTVQDFKHSWVEGWVDSPARAGCGSLEAISAPNSLSRCLTHGANLGVEVVECCVDISGFKVLPNRWLFDRTLC